MRGTAEYVSADLLADVDRLPRRGWTQVPGALDRSPLDPWGHRYSVAGPGVKEDPTC